MGRLLSRIGKKPFYRFQSVPRQDARLTEGYPALLAYMVNLPQPAISYARLFSYTTPDFLSENREIVRALRTIRVVIPERTVCLVTDAVLDDQKMFIWADQYGLEFITRATSEHRIEVYNERLDRWEGEKLAETDHFPDPLVLITNRPVRLAADARAIYNDWRRRPTVELYSRFVQEDGLDVEKIQLQKLERIRREFILILALSLFILRLPDIWHPSLILWFRRLGSAMAGTDSDWGGPYLLLYGIQRVLSAWSVFLAALKLPPHLLPTCPQPDG